MIEGTGQQPRQKREAHEVSFMFISVWGYTAQAEDRSVSGQRKQRSKFRPANPAGFEGQGALEKGAAEKKPSKTA